MNFSNTDANFAMFSVKIKNINSDKNNLKLKVIHNLQLKKD